MRVAIAVLLGLALVGSAEIASAQRAGRGGPGTGPGRGPGMGPGYGAQKLPPPIAAVFDLNDDGVLASDEINAAASQLLKLDKNQDGQLTADEVCLGMGQGCPNCPFGQGQGQGRGRGAGAKGKAGMGTPVIIALFDANQDGVLSAAEIANAPQVLRALDKNSDGRLTPDEIRPLPGCGGGPGAAHRWGQQ